VSRVAIISTALLSFTVAISETSKDSHYSENTWKIRHIDVHCQALWLGYTDIFPFSTVCQVGEF
jgi:hypothetical protein